MGKCLSLSVQSIINQEIICKDALPQNPLVEELTYEGVAGFIRAAMSHPVIGGRFDRFNVSRVTDLSQRISVMLNYAFKYNTITPFVDVLRLHTTMGIKEEEVDAFHKLLLKECYPNQAEWLPIQERILEDIKMFILHGAENKVRISSDEWGTHTEVPHFYRIVSNHYIFQDLFEEITHYEMDAMVRMIGRVLNPSTKVELLKEMGEKHSHLCISTTEYETFILLWLKYFQKDVLFVTKAMPIIDKLKGFMVMKHERKVLDTCHMIRVNRVLGTRYRKYKERKLRSLVATTIRASQHRDQDKLKKVAMIFQPNMNDKELFELSNIFKLVCPDFQNLVQ